MFEEEGLGSYFKQVVRDAIVELKGKGHSYCFSQEQVDYIKKEIPSLEYTRIDGVYRLYNTKFEEKRGRKKKDAE